MGLETISSACYILSDESSVAFYSTSNGYKNRQLILIKNSISRTFHKDNVQTLTRFIDIVVFYNKVINCNPNMGSPEKGQIS